MSSYVKEPEQMGEYDIRVKLLGTVVLENKWGRAEEPRTQSGKVWMLLKYLLANPGREISTEEIADTLWPEDAAAEGPEAPRTRLNRARNLLKPLQLNGKKGLIHFSDGRYSLNTRYTIYTDTELLLELRQKLRTLPITEQEGLELCITAIELFRGPYMDNPHTLPWIRKQRELYAKEFAALAQETLDRTIALDDPQVLPLLCRRAPMAAPQEESLHKAIVSCLTKYKLEIELMRYVHQLSYSGAAWLDKIDD